ncbi:MAG TPA: hypothetical protein DDW53_18720 [Lachnoclostridium sp.]|nr:hypothetical protein [Lachnoclostridium sp.]
MLIFLLGLDKSIGYQIGFIITALWWGLSGKFSAIMGPTLMSLTTAITGNTRWSILGIIPLFLIGLVIFMTLPKEQKNDER